MPAPLGNQNARKGKVLTDGLMRALAEGNWSRMRRGLDKLAEDFANGDAQARLLVFERIEGKVVARDDQDATDVKQLTMQDVVRLVMQARAIESVDATPTTIPAPSQPPTPQGDTGVKAVGVEGVVAVEAPHTTAPKNTSSSGSGSGD